MKIKAGQAIFATLDLVMEMASKQKAFHNIMLRAFYEDDSEYALILGAMNQEANRELNLIRAKLLQYSEIDINDLMNGEFEI